MMLGGSRVRPLTTERAEERDGRAEVKSAAERRGRCRPSTVPVSAADRQR